MHHHLGPLIAKQRIADQLRAAERARLGNEARARRREPHDAEPIPYIKARLVRARRRRPPSARRIRFVLASAVSMAVISSRSRLAPPGGIGS